MISARIFLLRQIYFRGSKDIRPSGKIFSLDTGVSSVTAKRDEVVFSIYWFDVPMAYGWCNGVNRFCNESSLA